MERNFQIDALKTLCAVLVVFLHTTVVGSEWVVPLTRCAVPCFLIISGYLLYDAERFQKRLVNAIKNIAVILLWSTILFALVKFSFAFKNQNFSFLSWKSVERFILFNVNPFGFHLWYLGAYLYTLVITLFLYRHKRLKILAIITPPYC